MPRSASLYWGWGVLLLAVIVWHGISISLRLGTDYLFSACFLANSMLAAGILARSGLLVGAGFAGVLIALPLWGFHVWTTGQMAPSSLAFHTVGAGVGLAAVRRAVLPRWLALAVIAFWLCSCLLARLFTDPQHNINAVFRVQEEWQPLFHDFRLFLAAQVALYVLVCLFIPRLGRRGFAAGAQPT